MLDPNLLEIVVCDIQRGDAFMAVQNFRAALYNATGNSSVFDMPLDVLMLYAFSLERLGRV